MAAKRNSFAARLVALSLAAGASIPAFAVQSTLEQGAEAQGNIHHGTVVLRALDKITARITEIELPVGEEGHFGTLALNVKYCRTRPPIEPPETFAYIEIDDLKRGGTRERVFEGWMVASSPALNALEHPVYDVWVMSCKTDSPEAQGDSR